MSESEPIRREGRLPRGPRAPALVQSLRFLRQPGPFAASLRQTYGDAFRFRTFVGRGIAICDPALARAVFSAPPETFVQHDVVGSIFGPRSVIATSGAVHKKQRKLLNPQFQGARIRSFYGVMGKVVRDGASSVLEAAFSSGEVVVMGDLAQDLTLNIILETVFGAYPGLDRVLARDVLLRSIEGFSPALLLGPRLHTPLFPPWRRFTRTRDAFDRWMDARIAERRAQDRLGDDVLGVLLATRYDDGAPMSDAEIRDQVATLLLAGHETTAIAIAWGIYFLLREPRVLVRLRNALDELGPHPSPEALVKDPYLQAVASESLRIEPIVTDLLRVCRTPLQLGEWTIPAGEIAAVMLVSILKDARVFPEPNEFRPERFLERAYSAVEFLPFGGGQRRCLGAAFAEAELAIALGTIIGEWDLRLADRRPERAVRRNITMGPERGVRVEVLGRRVTRSSPLSTGRDGTTSPQRGPAANTQP